MEEGYNIGIQWIMVFYLLLKGLLMTKATVHLASLGERFELTCPDSNVDSWQKLETLEILAAICENRMPKTISKKILVSDNCVKLTITNFTEKDVGLYRCYVFDKDAKILQYDFNVGVRTNLTHTTATLSENVEDSEVTNSTPKKNNNDGLSVRDIVIYILVVAFIIVILGLCYSAKKNTRKTKEEFPPSNIVQSTHLNERHSLVDSDQGIYDEIDETLFLENVAVNNVPSRNTTNAYKIPIESDNTDYLYPLHSGEVSSNSSVSNKSLNRSYLSFNESDKCHNVSGSEGEDDTTSYLHPYNSVDEHWKERINQYDELHLSNLDTDDSSDSSKKNSNDGYLNPYQPLKVGWKQSSHSYEASVTVHQCQPSSLDKESK